MRNLVFCLLASFWFSTFTSAQSIIPGASNTPHPADLILNISVDRIQNIAPPGLEVQISNSSIGSMSQGAQQTDSSGRVIFHTVDGTHEILVMGQGIDTYQTTVQISMQEAQHVEYIIVRSKSAAARVSDNGHGSSVAVSASSFKIPHKAESEFKAGSKAIEKKSYPEAIKRFQNAVAIYPDYSVAFNGLGVAEMASNQTSEAHASFEKAIKIDDHFAEAYRNLARIALGDHDFEEMDDLLTKSLSSEPLNAWALTYAAYAELQTHKFDLAIAHARAAHAVAHPGLASVHIVAADALEATQQPAEAVKEYRLYLSEDANGRDAPRAKEAIKRLTAAK